MGSLLVSIEKTFGGETWENTHCLRMNNADGVVVGPDMDALGIGTPITDANTLAGATVNPITRLVSFERYLLDPLIPITRVYVTDGKRNIFQDPDFFWSATLSLGGKIRATTIGASIIAPGTIAAVVNRNPLGFSSRGGRLFIRGMLGTGNIGFTMRGGVSWADPTQAASFVASLATAVTNSGINTMLNGGTNVATALYCIPHYLPKRLETATNKAGTLQGTTPVVSFTLGSPRSRQMLRGKKHKPPVFG